MENQLDNYVIQKRLAPALFGDVLLCQHRPSGDRVAVKRILKSAAAERRTLASKKRVRENVAFERELYHSVRALGGHQNLMALRDEIDFDGYLYMIFEYCARGELYEIVSNADDGKLSAKTTRKYLSQIASGVQFMHQSGYAHRDLSLENVLVTEEDDCKVCDFGLAAPANKQSNETVGKMFYMAPEVLAGETYDPKKADIWSLGVMLFIMLVGAPPVETASMADARFKIISAKGVRHLIQRWNLTDSLPAEAIDLVEGMLEVDASRRITIEQVVNHPFVNPQPAAPRRSLIKLLSDDCKATSSVTAPATPSGAHANGKEKENRVSSKIQRLFRRSSKHRIMAISSAQTPAAIAA
jgi:calcium-dependent protein kinase